MNALRHSMQHCRRCGTDKPESAFHRKGDGVQPWCKDCHNAYQRETRKRREPPHVRRRNNLKTRYGMDESKVQEMLSDQGGVCGICAKHPKRICVDHDHATGLVRGILCHHCNIKLPAVEDTGFRSSAIKYLEQK